MQGRKLAVLMWKHLMVRLRRFIHTPIEVLSPIVFVLILYCFKDHIKPQLPSQARLNEIRNTEVFPLSDLKPFARVLYTPDTKITKDLMDAVGGQLGLTRLSKMPDRLMSEKGYYGFSNYSEITEFMADLYTSEAIVLFHGMEGRDTWPDQPRLNYTIRLKKTFYTNSFEAFDGAKKPHRQFGEIYQPFMRLQWAIDSSFVKLLTGNSIAQELEVQEFPSIGRSSVEVMPGLCAGLVVICWMSLLLVFVFLMTRLLEERSTGIQELIRMVGVSTNLYGVSHFLNALPAGLVYSVGVTALLKASSNPIIENTNGFLIFIMLLLHFISVVAMAFACSYIAKNTQYTVSLSVLAYVVFMLPMQQLAKAEMRGVALLGGLLPHAPLQWFWTEVGHREQYGEGITFDDISSAHSPFSGSPLLGYVCVLLQILIFFSLSWYLSIVRPGNYGQPLPWNFLCQKHYWSKNEILPEADIDEEVPIVREAKYFEQPPMNLEPGIRIENVSKLYPKHKALSNVSLDVLKGEITVLLGHNGAGKTTLMSIITGMISPTEGKIEVNGIDTRRRDDEVRMQLGLCPQHNLFFSDLTVLEHVMFFTLLKGGSYKGARVKSMALLDRLGLKEKAHVHSCALSGGMKRRLQLACALAGDASVLVLDEPTSGLDVETRRELWDLLLSLRGDRTVLISTHFMEEADALGDRVAALHLGHLRCHATTMYLKKAIGTGYRLTFTTNGTPRDAAISEAVTSHVSEATLKEKTINSLSYNLPATASGHFPGLFTTLEKNKSVLGIETIGVGVSTLEEVFLKLCSDTDNTFNEDEVDTTRSEPTYNKVTGPVLYWRQFVVLIKRQIKYITYRKTSFLLLQVIIPILMMCLFTITANRFSYEETDRSSKLALDLDVYKPMLERRVLYDINSTGVSMKPVIDRYPKVNFVKTDNVAKAVLRSSDTDPEEYNTYLAGIEINDTNAKVLYTTTVRHAAPVALNLLSNALATRYIPRADGRTLTTYLHPVKQDGPIVMDSHDTLEEPKSTDMVLLWSVLTVFVIFSTNINSVSLPCKERSAGSRHIHVMSGCPVSLHWIATLLFHTAVCFVFLICAAAVCAAVFDRDQTINKPDVILSVMLVLTLGSLAFFALLYNVSCHFDERVAHIVLIIILVIFGLVTTTVKTATELFDNSESTSWSDVLLSVASYTMPPHATTVATAKCGLVARLNAYCELNRARCPNLFVAEMGFDMEKCCAGEKPRCYMCIDNYAPGKEMIILTVQFVFYMALVMLTQRGTFNYLHDLIFNQKYRNSSRKDQREDEIVRAEAIYVDKHIALPKQKIKESNQAMLVNDLHKNYFRLFGASCNAVQGVSFSVKRGECFGLLGVNGAGKSTTFKMLTGEECPTKGDIYANGRFLKDRQAYLRSLGYCPQFFGLDDFQTGRENLTLLLTLRGLDAADVNQEVKSWIQVVGLEKYSNQRVVGYSGGCTRRLAAAAALASGAPLTLLDEPTSGVDVAARRRVWSALKRGLRHGRSVIITSHSMDEMEALCSRIAIMSGGVVRAVGTPSELRARHAAGHAVVIKVRHARAELDEVDGSVKTQLELLKSSLQHKFNCTLKDEHKTMLHYHINETMRYSELFSALEDMKASYEGLVEDYSVTETTLEEVFLAFAKEQRDSPALARRNHVV